MLLLALYASLLLALTIALWARRGRKVDTHPICKKCRFDLIGLPPGTTRCSECGATLTTPGATKIGNRTPRRLWFAAGTALSLLSLFPAATLTYIRLTGANYLHWLPTKILLFQLGTATEPQKSALFVELERRLPTNAPAIIDFAITQQIDRTKPWDARWGDLAEHARAAGADAPGQWERYLLHAVDFRIDVRPRTAIDRGILVRYDGPIVRVGGTAFTFTGKFEISGTLELRSDASTSSIVMRTSKAEGPGVYGIGTFSFPTGETQRLNLGNKHIVIRHTYEIRGLGALGGVARQVQDYPTELLVVPSGQDIKPVTPAELKEPIRQSLQIQHLTSENKSVRINIYAENPPLDLAFDVFITKPGAPEERVGEVSFPKGANQGWGIGGNTLTNYARQEPLEIILRPSAKVASETIDMFQIYGGEIRLPYAPK